MQVRSNGHYIGYYGMMTLVALGIVAAIIWGLQQFYPSLISGDGTGLATGVVIGVLLAPVLQTAKRFYAQEQQAMGRGRAWVLALACTIVWLALVIGVSMAANVYLFGTWYGAANPADIREMMSDMNVLAIILGVVFLFVLLTNRMLFWAAIRGEIKNAARRAAKAAR